MFHNVETSKAREKEREENKTTEEGVQLRRKQGQDTSTGEQVWYSRRVEDGCQLHWAIITHGTKYELRLPDAFLQEKKVPEDQQTSSFEPAREYEDRVVPWTLKEETNKLRTPGLVRPGARHTRDYTVCQIGWTTLAKDGVDAEWKAAREALAADALGFDDCRSLLRSFARIIEKPDGCAVDYGWFAETLETPSHRLHDITPERAAKAFQHNGLWTIAGAGVGAAVVYGAYEAGGYMSSVDRHAASTGAPVAGVDGSCCTCWDWDCSDCGGCDCDCGGCEACPCFP